ncbi:MAG: CBS domain-containing protein [Myxococcaceae bacterium]|nr:MAG: CBS domain-containing protein [Myxococcaceae bacterium]
MSRVATVGDLMSTALIVVRDSDTIGVADAQMKLGAIRHIPVVDPKQNLVGILSAGDVLLALARGKKSVRVGETMSRNPVTVTPDTPVHEAIELLLENRFGSLPVLGTDGHLMGIVTDTDFLAAAREAFSAR